jgi:uncharacterized membrane protein YkoI
MRLAGPILAIMMGLGASAQAGDVTNAARVEPEVTATPEPGEPGRCLSRQEQRAKAVARSVVPLSKAVRTARSHASGDLLGAKLCERNGKLVYLLTLLGRDGKVVRATVDAGNGSVIGGR